MQRVTPHGVATAVFCAIFTFGGIGHLSHAAPMAQGMGHLGYPDYVMTLLGVAKLLGVAALLLPGHPLLKEWAYAGFAFDLIGATASHAFVGDPLGETVRPVVVLAIGAASYLLRPAHLRLVAAGEAPAVAPALEPAR